MCKRTGGRTERRLSRHLTAIGNGAIERAGFASSDGGSSNGRTADSDSASLGSNPSPPTNFTSELFLGKPAMREKWRSCWIFYAGHGRRVPAKTDKTCVVKCVVKLRRQSFATYFADSWNSLLYIASKLTELEVKNAKPHAVKYTKAAGTRPHLAGDARWFEILAAALPLRRQGAHGRGR